MSVTARLRKLVGNRRRARRRRVQRSARLIFTASPLDPQPSAGGAPTQLTFTGWTRDFSETGLALVVPDVSISEEQLNRALRITFELPQGPVVIQATAVRYEKLDQGSLVGVRITQINDRDHRRLVEHLRRLRFQVRDHAAMLAIYCNALLNNSFNANTSVASLSCLSWHS